MAVNNPATFTTGQPNSLSLPSNTGTNSNAQALGLGGTNNDQMVALARTLLGLDISNPNSQTVQNLTSSQVQILTGELKAQQARQIDPQGAFTTADKIMGLNDAQMVAALGEGPYEQAAAAADAFSALNGWRYYPTMNTLNNMITSGVDMSNTDGFRAAFTYMASQLPADIQQAQPWLATGLSKQGWADQMESLKTQWHTLTGDDAGFNQFTNEQLQQFAENPADVLTKWKEDPNVQNQYQWIKYGKNFDQFQQYMFDPANRQQVVARFGAGSVNDQNAYLQELENPLQGPPGGTGGGAITPTSQRVTQNVSGRTPVG